MNFFKNTKILLAIIIFLSLFLRLWGLNFGLPYLFHQDEPIVVNHALAYGTGDLNPHFFAIPPLTSYLLFFVYGVFFFVGKILSMWGGAEDFALFFIKDPSLFYIIGRFFIGVIPGTLCVFFSYVFSKRFMSVRAALCASCVMAVTFLNVVNSHYIYTDMLLVLFVLIAYNMFFSTYKEPSLLNFCITGVILGITIGIKYNAVLLGVPYFLVCFVNEKRKICLRNFFVGGFCALLFFIVVNPFVVLSFSEFFQSFFKQSKAFWYTGPSHHIVYSLKEGVSLPILGGGLIGLIALMLEDKKWWWILVSFPVVLYGLMIFKSQHFSRYVLPLIPFLAIGFSYFLFDYMFLQFKSASYKTLIVVLVVLTILPTLAKSIKADMIFSSKDTRIMSSEWISNNLPEGTKLACDSTNFRPMLAQPYSQLIQKKDFLAKQYGLEKLKTKKLDLMIRASNKDDQGYPIYFLSEEPSAQGQFLATTPALPYNVDDLLINGIEYVVINGQIVNERKEIFIKELEERSDLVKVFSPYSEPKIEKTMDPIATTCIPVVTGELFSRSKSGPFLKIYKIRK